MKFFTYRQNNSGGSFDSDHERGISHFVVIEAQNAAYANYKATEIGIDCSCCGDRWYEADGPGDDEPSEYGKPIPATLDEYNAGTTFGLPRWIKDGPQGYVHYADGRVEAVLA